MEEIRREGRAMRADLRRAFALGVREARNERRRRQELDARLDEKISQLAAAQLAGEEKLQGLYTKWTPSSTLCEVAGTGCHGRNSSAGLKPRAD